MANVTKYMLTITGTLNGETWENVTEWIFRESVDEWLETIGEEIAYYDGELIISDIVLVEH